MKKKLNLKELSVKSFVTEVGPAEVKGGTGETLYSCLAYITCDVIRCYATTQANQCVTDTIQLQA